MKVKKGSVTVVVGFDEDNNEEGLHKLVIPISYLYHPLLQSLLDKAHDLYGYPAAGPLRVPCSVDDFLHLTWIIEREAGGYTAGCQRGSSSTQLLHYHHLPFHRSLSCTSC